MLNLSRRDILLTNDQINILNKAKVAIFGLGGVGGYTLEALVRMGINSFIIVDGDTYEESNLNRQLLSTTKTIGLYKTRVWEGHIKEINPDAKVVSYNIFYDENSNIDLSDISIIIDAIDDVKAKVLLIKKAKELNIPIISMMGAGNRLTSSFMVTDIYKTSIDPLAKKMRKLLKEEGINKLTVVSSNVNPIKTDTTTIGSISYVIASAGLKLSEGAIDILLK